jgi:hypothetical protein
MQTAGPNSTARLQSLSLTHFKAFRTFSASFHGSAVLIGPNNAGKSTLISALRTSAHLINQAHRLRASTELLFEDEAVLGHVLPVQRLPLIYENLRHEFRNASVVMRLRFENGASLTAFWPADDDTYAPEPFPTEVHFFCEREPGVQIRRPPDARELLPAIGVVPPLTPLERDERLLSPTYVSRNLDGRLASRHFRNQLYLLDRDPETLSIHEGSDDADLTTFLTYAEPWLQGFSVTDVRISQGNPPGVDVFVQEPNSNEKEIVWAGDGYQVWLQFLFHLYRLRRHPTVVVDEPDVYLHADLQRQLIALVESGDAQYILATHSAEIAAESPIERILWIDRTRTTAVRARPGGRLEEISKSVGSQFNLRLARALRTRVVLLLEGEDFKLLRRLAHTLGHDALSGEKGVAPMPIGGSTQIPRVEAVAWLAREFLDEAVSTFVILDRDYRSDEEIASLEAELTDAGVHAHIWRLHELENYLIVPSALARLSGLGEEEVEDGLDRVTNDLREETRAALCGYRVQATRASGLDASDAIRRGQEELDACWESWERRLELCGGKEVLTELNRVVVEAGGQRVSAPALADVLEPDEVHPEVRRELGRIAHALEGT